MKKSFGVSFLVIFFSGCADSGQGLPPTGESGTSSYGGKGTNAVVSTNAVYETPARPVPIPRETEAQPQESERQSPDQGTDRETGEQGSQVTPEPRTGDDVNPDSVNPRK